MTKKIFRPADLAGLVFGAALLAALTACIVDGSNQRTGYRASPAVQATVVFQDDYDYYPGYEIYYSRNRNEFVYRDGDAWVRRPEPRGVAVNVLLAAPSVRVDFHDSPAQHHDSVVRTYPRNWTPPGRKPDVRDEGRKPAARDAGKKPDTRDAGRKPDARDDRKPDKKDDQKPDHQRD